MRIKNDPRNYKMEDLGMKELIGCKVLAAEINPTKDIIILTTDKGKLFLSWSGDCCAKCFIAAINGSDNLIDATILSAEDSVWKKIVEEDDFELENSRDVIESMGTKLKTTKGYVDIETRLSHNGYYSGMIVVSRDNPTDNSACPMDINDIKFTKLTDFSN